MAVPLLRAGGRLRTRDLYTSQARSSCSKNRQSFFFPSPIGWAGTYPNRAHLMSVRLSIRINAAASTASRIRSVPLWDAWVPPVLFISIESITIPQARDRMKKPVPMMGNQTGKRPIKVGRGVIPGGYDGQPHPSFKSVRGPPCTVRGHGYE